MVWASLLIFLAPSVLANLDASLIERVGAIEAADLDSCKEVASVVRACVSAPSFTRLPIASQAKCLCCASTINIASEYKDCASYVRTADPSETEAYSLYRFMASDCASSRTLCTPTPTITRSAVTPTPAGLRACSSLGSILRSCSRAMPSFYDSPGSSQASCVCYNTMGGTFTTAFDRFASSCASYYSTASPSEYSLVKSLTTFCSGKGSNAADTGDSNAWFPPEETGSITPTFTGTTTVTSSSPSSTSTSSGLAGRPVAVSGPVAWIASAWTFFVSFFVLV